MFSKVVYLILTNYCSLELLLSYVIGQLSCISEDEKKPLQNPAMEFSNDNNVSTTVSPPVTKEGAPPSAPSIPFADMAIMDQIIQINLKNNRRFILFIYLF